jgi:uncharacterized membrane protein
VSSRSKGAKRRARAIKRKAQALARDGQPQLTAPPFLQMPDVRQNLPAIAQITATAEFYQGPFPHPEFLKKFDEIEPGSSARLLNLIVDQGRHRMGLETHAVNSDIKRSWWGLILGFVVVMSACGVGGAAVWTGAATAGCSLIGAAIASLAGCFVVGTYSRRSERIAKAALNPPPGRALAKRPAPK